MRSLRTPLIEHDIDPDALMLESGISPDDVMRTNGEVPLRGYLRFMELAAQHSGNPILGVHLARSAGPETLGAIGFLFLSSKTILEALQNLAHYINLLQGVTYAQVIQDEEETSLVYQILHARDHDCRQDVEFSLTLTKRLIKIFAEDDIDILGVHFRHGPLVDKKLYEKQIKAPVFFNQDQNCVTIPASANRVRGKVLDESLSPILRQYLDKEFETVQRMKTFGDQVEYVLYGNRIMPPLTALKVAHHIGMSEATLYRRLKAEGISFSDLLDTRNYNLSKEYLQTTTMSVTEIAHLIGFAESASFTRAFARWSKGLTPTDYRRQLKASGA
nr:AraC family transcriptional regulator [Kordiimonas marina]